MKSLIWMNLEGLPFVNTDNNYDPIELSKSFLTKHKILTFDNFACRGRPCDGMELPALCP